MVSADGKFIVLDCTAFFPDGGGVEWDTGVMTRKSYGKEFKVMYAGKFHGDISHEVDAEGLKAGDEVHCALDWDKRYLLMRYHTAAHVVSGVFHNEFGYKITGNQLTPEKGRIDFDMEEFDVESIRRWWNTLGRGAYPHAKSLTITADSGGSNSPRTRLWKTELQRLSNETGLALRVRHFPPGTSKWNKIEHWLFSFISQNWRGKPLISHAVIINLIAATTTTKGLKVDCVLDTNKYMTGRKIPDEEYGRINLVPDPFHGEWNYAIKPHR